MSETSFEDRARILSELWMDYREEEEFQDFIEYNDLGLPLSYAYANDIAEPTQAGKDMILETWELLLDSLGIEEDTGFESFDDLISAYNEDNDDSYQIPIRYIEEDDWEDTPEEEEEDEPGYAEGFNDGFEKGAAKEQERIQEIVIMQKRWAKENRKGNEFLFWDSVGEVLTPINFEYDEEEYKKSLEADGF